MSMDIYIVLTMLLVTSGCSIFLGHAAGYGRGRSAGYKAGARETAARWKMRLNTVYGKYAETDSVEVEDENSPGTL